MKVLAGEGCQQRVLRMRRRTSHRSQEDDGDLDSKSGDNGYWDYNPHQVPGTCLGVGSERGIMPLRKDIRVRR